MLRTSMLAAAAALAAAQTTVYIDNSQGLGRRFDGIGGLSGGGATSVMLPTYQEPYRSQILDYLFKPNFGAALQILKVEIGGDAQSTDGAEHSHMHNPWDENYERGYEWWLMVEAKKRNPNIKIYGLPWAWPQWVSCNENGSPALTNCTNNPYTWPQQSATYITKWVAGAKNTYNVSVDYLGIWNERSYDATYIKTLRATLDANGFENTAIVASDSSWGIAGDILNDPSLAAAVDVIGAHYPGTSSSPQAEQTGKQLWASEDDSTASVGAGIGCWARIINDNYTRANITAVIMWNLISAYMKGTNWYLASMMTALQPWSGAYEVPGPVWVSAHTTQFTKPGDFYLRNGTGPGTGSGPLALGGSYVSFQDSDTKDLTIVIQKFSRDHSPCVRPGLPDFFTADETVTFKLAGDFAGITSLYLWTSHMAFTSDDTTHWFEQQTPVPVVNGQFTMNITVDSLYTLTTKAVGQKGSYGAPPTPTPWPGAYTDNFNSYPISSQPAYYSDQNGAFQVVDSEDPAHGLVLQQLVPLRPITWGGDIRPHSLLGHRDMVNVSFYQDVYLTAASSGVVMGARCAGTDDTSGFFLAIDDQGNWNVTTQMSKLVGGSPLTSGKLPISFGPGQWATLRLDVNGSTASAWINGQSIFSAFSFAGSVGASGHVLIGTIQYNQYPMFDNLQLYSTTLAGYCGDGHTTVAVGTPISLVECEPEVGPRTSSQWTWTPLTQGSPLGTFSIAAGNNLCMSVVPNGTSAWPVVLATCNPSDSNQQFAQNYTQVYQSSISNPASGRCLDIYGGLSDIGAQIDAWPCNGQLFYYTPDYQQIINVNAAVCLGVC